MEKIESKSSLDNTMQNAMFFKPETQKSTRLNCLYKRGKNKPAIWI